MSLEGKKVRVTGGVLGAESKTGRVMLGPEIGKDFYVDGLNGEDRFLRTTRVKDFTDDGTVFLIETQNSLYMVEIIRNTH